MQVETSGMPIISPGPALAWQTLHGCFRSPACCLWLNAIGCRGGGELASEGACFHTASTNVTVVITDCLPASARPCTRKHASIRQGWSASDFAALQKQKCCHLPQTG